MLFGCKLQIYQRSSRLLAECHPQKVQSNSCWTPGNRQANRIGRFVCRLTSPLGGRRGKHTPTLANTPCPALPHQCCNSRKGAIPKREKHTHTQHTHTHHTTTTTTLTLSLSVVCFSPCSLVPLGALCLGSINLLPKVQFRNPNPPQQAPLAAPALLSFSTDAPTDQPWWIASRAAVKGAAALGELWWLECTHTLSG